MAEDKIISTQNIVTIIGSSISIRSYYSGGESILNTISAFISEIVQIIESVDIIEGELCIQMNENYPLEIDYVIDSNGDLIVTADDAEKYSLDENNGTLIYTV